MGARRIALLTLTLVTGGCFLFDDPGGVKGKGGPFPNENEEDPIRDGAYVLAGTSLSPVTCGVMTSALLAQFPLIEVFASEDEIEIIFGSELIRYDVYPGGHLIEEGSPYEDTLDFADPAISSQLGLSTSFDCVLREVERWTGDVLDFETFALENAYELSEQSGTQCAAVASSAGFASLPCADVATTLWAAN